MHIYSTFVCLSVPSLESMTSPLCIIEKHKALYSKYYLFGKMAELPSYKKSGMHSGSLVLTKDGRLFDDI